MPASSAPDRSLPHLPGQARTLGFLLREVYGQLQQHVYDAVAAAGHPGLRAAHSPVLRHLPTAGGRVADLARATGLAKQSVSYVVEDLVALGYLRAEPDPEDGRARRLNYTAHGRRLLASLLAASEEAEAALASTLGPQRVRSLRETLELVLRDPSTPGHPAGPDSAVPSTVRPAEGVRAGSGTRVSRSGRPTSMRKRPRPAL